MMTPAVPSTGRDDHSIYAGSGLCLCESRLFVETGKRLSPKTAPSESYPCLCFHGNQCDFLRMFHNRNI